MTYETYRYIFIGAAIACGVLLAVSVILFFTLKIPKVISDLSGRTARKAIENIRKQNELSGDKTYQSSAINLERGKITDKISPSGRLEPGGETPFGTGVITAKLETVELAQPAGETELLTQPAGDTELPEPAVGETAPLAAPPAFTVEYEITFLHTSEVIPWEGVQ